MTLILFPRYLLLCHLALSSGLLGGLWAVLPRASQLLVTRPGLEMSRPLRAMYDSRFHVPEVPLRDDLFLRGITCPFRVAMHRCADPFRIHNPSSLRFPVSYSR